MSTELIVGIANSVLLILIPVVLFFGRHWIKNKIKEDMAWETKRREQAAGIAELFSLHHKWKYYPDEADACKYELQKKYWELSLWLDAKILRAVNEAFDAESKNKDEHAHKRALITARKHIISSSDNVEPEEITHWLSNMELALIHIQNQSEKNNEKTS